jgi:hypothetical protein
MTRLLYRGCQDPTVISEISENVVISCENIVSGTQRIVRHREYLTHIFGSRFHENLQRHFETQYTLKPL